MITTTAMGLPNYGCQLRRALRLRRSGLGSRRVPIEEESTAKVRPVQSPRRRAGTRPRAAQDTGRSVAKICLSHDVRVNHRGWVASGE